jgi:hypothetical protein
VIYIAIYKSAVWLKKDIALINWPMIPVGLERATILLFVVGRRVGLVVYVAS